VGAEYPIVALTATMLWMALTRTGRQAGGHGPSLPLPSRSPRP
jgi:hypothetical protein